MKDIIAIGFAGGSSSGKSSVVEELKCDLEKKGHKVLSISLDSFYKDLDKISLKLAKKEEYNFDHPNACDKDLLIDTLMKIKKGENVEIPHYSFIEHRRSKESTLIISKDYDILLLEGIFGLYFEEIRNMLDFKVFVEVDADVRLSRRIFRDVKDRGRTLNSVIDQYLKFVKPSHEEFIEPTRKFANIILPEGVFNKLGISTIFNQILNLNNNKPYKESFY